MPCHPTIEDGIPSETHIVHVVGCVTDEVFSFLGPATAALAKAGHRQTVVMIDDVRYRHHLAALTAVTQLILTPKLRNLYTRWKTVLRGCEQILEAGSVNAVHLHGVLPGLVGSYALRAKRLKTATVFSPHSSRVIATLQSAGVFALMIILRTLLHVRGLTIINSPTETRNFKQWSPPELIESPAARIFFETDRNEARHPLVVAGGRTHSARNAELYCQLAVLLSDEDLKVSFNWLGTVDDLSRARMSAAGIGVYDVPDNTDRSERLTSGWVYIAPGPTRGFQLSLVEAMAAGLPCVTFDCAEHADLIQHGTTGFLCQSEREMVEHIAKLIDDAHLRLSIGENAREYARYRFDEAVFQQKLLAVYSHLGDARPRP